MILPPATSYQFTVQGPPQPWQRAGTTRSGKRYTQPETRRYEQVVGEIGLLMRPRTWRLDGSYHLTVVAYFADYRRRDADNVGKAVADALNKVAYDDDNQVLKVSTEKQVDPTNPRTVVTIQWVGERMKRASKRKGAA